MRNHDRGCPIPPRFSAGGTRCCMGLEPTAAEVTLFYNGGKSKYRIEKMLSPSQQLWLDIGRLIRDQVPDSDGHTLPPDTMAGSYELRDLDHAAVGFLYEGKLVIDKTYGHAAYGCGDCCGLTIPELIPDPFGGPPDIDYDEDMQSTEQCGGQLVNIAGDATDWKSSNTAVATLPNSTLHTVAIGSATGSATVTVQATHPAPQCPVVTYDPQQPINVCPSSSSVGSTTAESLAKVLSTYKTGLGSVVGIQLSPSAPTGLIVTETLSPGSNTCPTNFPTNVCTTNGNLNTASLSVGTAGTATDGTPFPATPNVMWDEHVVASASNLLGPSGKQCSIQCSQQYSCGGTVIGNYTITYTFSTGTISGTPVTNVTAAVQ